MKSDRFLEKLFKEIVSFIILLFDFLIIKIPQKEKIFYNVCCIKVDALGDFILWLNSSFSIANEYKYEKKVLICNQINYDLAKKLKHFDYIYPIDVRKFNRNLKYRFDCLRRFNSLNIELVLQPTFSREFLLGDSILRAINSNNKIGFLGDYKNQNYIFKIISNNWYSRLIKINNFQVHELELNKRFIESLDIKIKKNFKLKELTNLVDFNFDFKNNYILVNPGASHHSRAWSSEKYIELIKYILDNSKYFVVLTGSKNDMVITNLIMKAIYNERLIDFSGHTSVIELIEIIRLAKFVISNDSASVHISYIVGTKAICISGGNNFGRFVPYPVNNNNNNPLTFYPEKCLKNNWNCSKSHKCIDQIDIQLVKNYIKFIF